MRYFDLDRRPFAHDASAPAKKKKVLVNYIQETISSPVKLVQVYP